MPKILIKIRHKDKTLPSVMRWSKRGGKGDHYWQKRRLREEKASLIPRP